MNFTSNAGTIILSDIPSEAECDATLAVCTDAHLMQHF